jgi:hypothetical protein
MRKWSVPILVIVVLAMHASARAETCDRPIRVNSMDKIGHTTLALKNIYGPAAVESDCTILDRKLYGTTISFFILPQSLDNADSVYVYIKSYRTMTTEPPDKIKMSRGGSWYFSDTNGKPQLLDRMDDMAFTASTDDWDRSHALSAAPAQMEGLLHARWHAYTDRAETVWSSQKAPFWKTRADFDFSHGTLTNILIRFPPGGKTPAPFQIGVPKAATGFELEITSNADGLAGTYRFVMR